MERTQPGSIPEGLIDLREQNPLFDAMLDGNPPKAAPERQHAGVAGGQRPVAKAGRAGRRGMWAAAGVLLLGLVVTMVGVIKVRTAERCDRAGERAGGRRCRGRRRTDHGYPERRPTVKIEAQPGKHGVIVRRGDDLLLREIVTLESGKEFKLRIRLELRSIRSRTRSRRRPKGLSTRATDRDRLPGIPRQGRPTNFRKSEVPDPTRTAIKEGRPDAPADVRSNLWNRSRTRSE